MPLSLNKIVKLLFVYFQYTRYTKSARDDLKNKKACMCVPYKRQEIRKDFVVTVPKILT